MQQHRERITPFPVLLSLGQVYLAGSSTKL